jgi:hypothetical protein
MVTFVSDALRLAPATGLDAEGVAALRKQFARAGFRDPAAAVARVNRELLRYRRAHVVVRPVGFELRADLCRLAALREPLDRLECGLGRRYGLGAATVGEVIGGESLASEIRAARSLAEWADGVLRRWEAVPRRRRRGRPADTRAMVKDALEVMARAYAGEERRPAVGNAGASGVAVVVEVVRAIHGHRLGLEATFSALRRQKAPRRK